MIISIFKFPLPLIRFTVAPQTNPLVSIGCRKLSLSVLHILPPLAVELRSIRIFHDATTRFVSIQPIAPINVFLVTLCAFAVIDSIKKLTVIEIRIADFEIAPTTRYAVMEFTKVFQISTYNSSSLDVALAPGPLSP